MVQSGALLYLLVIGGVFAGQCLLAIWMATSSRPFLLRALVVWAAVAALIPVRAYVPALFFTMTAAVTFGLVWIIRRWQEKSTPVAAASLPVWRFQLADLFVLILFIATVISLGRYCRIPALAYFFLPLLAAPFATVLVFSHFSVAGSARRWMAIATFISILISAACLMSLSKGNGLQLPITLGLYTSPTPHSVMAVQGMLIGCLMGCIIIAIWLMKRLWRQARRPVERAVYLTALAGTTAIGLLLVFRYVDLLWIHVDPQFGSELLLFALYAMPAICMTALVAGMAWLRLPDPRGAGKKIATQRVLLVVATIAALPLAWLYWEMLWPTPFPPPPASEINHYNRLLSIGHELTLESRHTRDGRVPLHCQRLLDEAVALLGAPNFVPTDALEAESQSRYSIQSPNGHDIGTICVFLMGMANESSEQSEFDRGADYALAAVRYAGMYQRSASTGQASFGSSQSLSALIWLTNSSFEVSPAKAREIIDRLERTLAERDDLAVLDARDRIYWERSGGWQARLMYLLSTPTFPDTSRSVHHDQIRGFELMTHATQVMVAIRLFHDSHNRFPNDLAELTPKYLLTIPLDPYSGEPLVYRPTESLFKLYSVGHDRTDNGGRFDPAKYYLENGFDIDLTWSDRRR